jgi:hypothetical protein
MSVRQIHEPIVFSNETVEIELDANQWIGCVWSMILQHPFVRFVFEHELLDFSKASASLINGPEQWMTNHEVSMIFKHVCEREIIVLSLGVWSISQQIECIRVQTVVNMWAKGKCVLFSFDRLWLSWRAQEVGASCRVLYLLDRTPRDEQLSNVPMTTKSPPQTKILKSLEMELFVHNVTWMASNQFWMMLFLNSEW